MWEQAVVVQVTFEGQIIDSQFQLPRALSASLAHAPAGPNADKRKRTAADDEDIRLVEEIRHGNPDALTVLFEKYSGMIFGFARRWLNNASEAEEVVQQVFIDTYKAIHQFDPSKASYKTWLFRFAYQRTINRKKHLEVKGYYVSDELDEQLLAAEINESAGKLVRELSSLEAVQLVRQLLKSIQPNQRTAIEMTFFDGFTAEEIAARTGESAVAVRHHLYRGLSKLRKSLMENKERRTSPAGAKKEGMLVVDSARLL